MKHKVIEAPDMGPIWLQRSDYGRISNLSKRLGISETEVIQNALKSYENTLVADVAYVCDGRVCDLCSYSECHHTLDIHHAKNFTETEPGKFMENE